MWDVAEESCTHDGTTEHNLIVVQIVGAFGYSM